MATHNTENSALDAFVGRVVEAQGLMAEIQAAIESVHDQVSPEQINWGHVGDMGRVVEALTAAKAAGKENEQVELMK